MYCSVVNPWLALSYYIAGVACVGAKYNVSANALAFGAMSFFKS